MLNADALYWAARLQSKLDAERRLAHEQVVRIQQHHEMLMQQQNMLLFNGPVTVYNVPPHMMQFAHQMPQPEPQLMPPPPAQMKQRKRNHKAKIDEVMSFVEAYIKEHGVSPSRNQIQAGVQCTLGSMRRCLAILNTTGKLNVPFATKRGITLPKPVRSLKMDLSHILNADEEAPHQETEKVTRRLR